MPAVIATPRNPSMVPPRIPPISDLESDEAVLIVSNALVGVMKGFDY